MNTLSKSKRLSIDLSNVGLRAQATAGGLVQLCIELRRAGVLPEAAVERIKAAIANEILATPPRHVATEPHGAEVRGRLDRIFAGQEDVGPADGIAATPDTGI